jgi:hypothetical protein
MPRSLSSILLTLVPTTTLGLAQTDGPSLLPTLKPFVEVEAPVIALKHVKVIDGRGGPAVDDQTVIIDHGRIGRIGSSASVTPPDDAKILELAGRTVSQGWALAPHAPVVVKPYIADDLLNLDLAVGNVTTVAPSRTFWDKVVILHGLRRWWDRRGELKGGGQRVSRHYYDVYRLLASKIGQNATGDMAMAEDCVRHARIFFNRPDLDLASATPGSFALTPHDGMIADLR